MAPGLLETGVGGAPPTQQANPGDSLTAANEGQPLVLRGDPIQILERLGQGGVGAVYRGLWRDQAVAVKLLLPGSNAETEERFALEARVGLSLEHDNVVTMLGAGTGPAGPFLVLEFINGWSLDDLLGPGETVPESVALAIGRQILAGLTHAHGRGVIHRDIKPANVLVDRAGRVKLADFSLAKCGGEVSLSRTGAVLGTPLFMSPEQWRGGADVDGRSDLYAVGALLYALVVGTPPFAAPTIPELVHLITTAAAVPVARAAEVSPEFAAVVDRALAKDRRDRFADALAMAHALDGALSTGLAEGESAEVRRWLQTKLSQRSAAHISMGSGLGLCEPPLVGRDAELQWLEQRVDRARRGHAQVLVLEACSGMGKTRLLDELTHRAERSGARVFRGCGVDGAQHPLACLQGVFEEVRLLAREQPDLYRTMGAHLGPAAPLVAEILPELTADAGAPLSTRAPEQLGRERGVAAIGRMLEALGAVAAPALVVLDDCQWADPQVVEALRRWALRLASQPGAGSVAVLATWRLHDPDESSPFAGLGPDQRLSLDPLSEEATATLVGAMVEGLAPAAVGAAARLSAGNPLLAVSVLLNMIERGTLTRHGRAWVARDAALEDLQPSHVVGDVLAARLGTMGPELTRFLTAGAVLGKHFAAKAAADLSDVELDESGLLLVPALRRHFVVVHGQDVSFVHDQVREAVLRGCGPQTRRLLHLRAAHYFDRVAPAEFSIIAYHFDAAGQPRRAFPFALVAARAAHESRALGPAEAQYRIALRGMAQASVAERIEVLEGLSQVLILVAAYAEVPAYLSVALELAEAPDVRARLMGHQAELTFKQGDMVGAARLYEQALVLLGEPVPDCAGAFVRACLWEAGVQVAHTLAPGRFLATGVPADPAREQLRHHLFAQLISAYYLGGGATMAATLWSALRPLNRAERFEPTAELGRICSNHGFGVAIARGSFARGHRYVDRSIAIHRDCADPGGEGIARMLRAVILVVQARYPEALVEASAAAAQLDATGNPWDRARARWAEGMALWGLGRFKDGYDLGIDLWRESQLIDDGEGAGHALDVLAFGLEGRLEPWMVDRLVEVRPEYRRVTYGARVGYARAEGAHHRVIDEVEAGIRQRLIAPDGLYAIIYGFFAESLRLAHGQALPLRRAEAKALRARWRQVLRTLRPLARRFPLGAPLALRELAYDAAWRGRPAQAAALLDRGLAMAEAQHASFFVGLTRLARGDLGLALGWPGAKADLQMALELLEGMGAEVSAGQARRLL